MATLLEQLRQYTKVVADSGDMNSIRRYRPQDSTTNPSLITAAAEMPAYHPIVDEVLRNAKQEARHPINWSPPSPSSPSPSLW